ADIGVRRMFDQMVDRIAAEDLDPLALHDFRNRSAELHGRLSPQGSADCHARPLRATGTGKRRTVKHAWPLASVALICATGSFPGLDRRRGCDGINGFFSLFLNPRETIAALNSASLAQLQVEWRGANRLWAKQMVLVARTGVLDAKIDCKIPGRSIRGDG